MKRLSIRETRRALSHLDMILAAEGEITVIKRGKEVARIVPIDRRVAIPSHRDLRAKMPIMTESSEKLIRDDRDEG